jgi:outer membrane cobalamin receptor
VKRALIFQEFQLTYNLRDGASAQYGSDAIAGVINIILKDSPKGGSATLRTGLTSAGDGEMIVFPKQWLFYWDDDDRVLLIIQ